MTLTIDKVLAAYEKRLEDICRLEYGDPFDVVCCLEDIEDLARMLGILQEVEE